MVTDQERIELLEAELDEARMLLREARHRWAALVLEGVADLPEADLQLVLEGLSREQRGILRRALL